MKFSKLLFTLALVMLFFNSCQQDNDVKYYPDLQVEENTLSKKAELELFFESDELKKFEQFLLKVEMRGKAGKTDVKLKKEFLDQSEILEGKLAELNLTSDDILAYYDHQNSDVVSGLFVFGDDFCCENAKDDLFWCKRGAVNTFGWNFGGAVIVTVVAIIVIGSTGGIGASVIISLEQALWGYGVYNTLAGFNLIASIQNCENRYRADASACFCNCEDNPDC